MTRSAHFARILPAAILLAFLLPGWGSTSLWAQSTSGESAPASPFSPHQILEPPEGPPLHIYRSGASDVISLRVSVPFVEGWRDAGAGQVLARMADERMDAIGSRIGARSRAIRTATSLVYEVSGPTADLDFLAWVLRAGLEEPDPSTFSRIRRDATTRVERILETPEGALALEVRREIDPDAPPLHGTLPGLERLTPDRLHELWRQAHRETELRIVAVGPLDAEVVLAAVSELGVPSGEVSPVYIDPGSGSSVRLDPEVIRQWEARAWRLAEGRDPRAMVAARILSDTYRNRPGDFELGVELWEMGSYLTLVLSGAAYPRSRAVMQSRVRELASDAASTVSDEMVTRHAARIRGELLEAARTPWDLASLVGQALDAGEGPDAISRLASELDNLDATAVRSFLEELSTRSPITVEITP